MMGLMTTTGLGHHIWLLTDEQKFTYYKVQTP